MWNALVPYSFRRHLLHELQVRPQGPANLKTKIGGKEVDLSKATSSTKVESRDYEVIKDSDNMQGILTTGDYMCPKCDCVEVYAYLEQTRSSDEPETRMLTCKNCGNGWRVLNQ